MENKSLKALIGDDSALIRKQLKDVLVECGCLEVFTAANGQEAIDLYKVQKPDLIFLDIVMPVCDGIEATKAIHSIDSHACVVIISSVGTQVLLKNAIEAGAKDFIQKPVKKELIKSIVEKRLKGEL
ncbi:response regulator [Eubacterium oxidoreducens]|uniref:Stage 0 sporulation protein A homolog n=1 Tax=Eubacterium oxidoreducens TaxID=1732 RepID=A0A1G6AKD2_EUBOX|nr:response regulator [Eubacterium oxidoreducens]SDB08835.1 two-component system, chemotaxis family, response regulator CheY [Eubacterium oxidoreducens]